MKTMKVTQTKSGAHRLKSHKACLKGLGLRRIGHTPSTRGMVNRINYMVKVEEA